MNTNIQLIAEQTTPCEETGFIFWGPVIAFLEDGNVVIIRCDTPDGPQDVMFDISDVRLMAATVH